MYIHGGAASPRKLIFAMTKHGKEAGLKNVEVMQAPVEGESEYCKPEYEGTKLKLTISIPLVAQWESALLMSGRSWVRIPTTSKHKTLKFEMLLPVDILSSE